MRSLYCALDRPLGYDGPALNLTLKGLVEGQGIRPKGRAVMLKGFQ